MVWDGGRPSFGKLFSEKLIDMLGKPREKNEEITFKDYFITDLSLEEGVYTLELHLENPILAKNVKATKKVELFRK